MIHCLAFRKQELEIRTEELEIKKDDAKCLRTEHGLKVCRDFSFILKSNVYTNNRTLHNFPD